MDDNFKHDLIHVCSVLKKHDVQYMIVGGTAVALYGFNRLSRGDSGEIVEKHDFDFWVNPTYPNYYKLLDALEELGQDVSEFRDEQTPNPKESFFKLEMPNFSLDFLPNIPGLDRFSKSYADKVVAIVDEVEVVLIQYRDLIRNKKASGRPKDIDDIKNLEEKRNDTIDE